MGRLAHRIDRWKKKPRFRTPGARVLPGLLLLALLLVLRLREPAPPEVRPLPAPTPAPTRTEAPPVQTPPEPPPPEPAQAEAVQKGCPDGCEAPPAGCDIKGNISKTGERIYHVLGQRWYDETVISPGKGEFWFCTEAEARANGWRKARV
jgi:hypothetical protein